MKRIVWIFLAACLVASSAWAGSSGGGSGGSGAATSVAGSATLPATCTEKDLYQDTDSGGTEFYVCTAANTWVKTIAATDNVATATALAANGANCSAGNYPLGVDASGAVESCTAAATGTIGGTLGATDNYGTCADGTGAATAQPCTDQALFPGGASDSAPGIAFQNDPNTGLWGVGGDTLAVETGGSRRVLFDATSMQFGGTTALMTAPGISFTGYRDEVYAITGSVASPLALGVTFGNYLFTNQGATSMRAVTLPDASAGYTVKFCNQDSDGIRINANTGDTIRRVASVTGSGGYIETTTIGACIVIKALNATENYVVDSNDLATDSWTFN